MPIDPRMVAWDDEDKTKIDPRMVSWSGGKSPDYKRGQEAPGALQGLASVLNGPTFGFGDELLGGAGALIDKLKGNPEALAALYRQNRDFVRGMQDRQQQDNPWTTTLTQAMASAPLAAINAPFAAASRVTGAVPNITRAAVTGGVTGAVGGLGNSTAEDAQGMGIDALKGGAFGAGAGAATSAVGNVLGAVGSNVMQRVSPTSAEEAARQKIAEALARDARGTTFTSGAANPVTQAQSRLNRLGDEAAIADAGGKNTRNLLDTLATLPGRTKDQAEQFLHQRQATSGNRLRTAADNALGVNGQRFADTVESLAETRARNAGPLYKAIEGATVTIDDDIAGLIRRASGRDGEARALYRAQTGIDVGPLTDLKPGQQVPFTLLDTLKQSLYDAADSAKRSGSNKMGAAWDDIRVNLTKKLDEVSPKTQAGDSIYKLARDEFAGKSQLIDAAEIGRKALRGDALDLRSTVNGYSRSEMDAFKIGAFEALRDKAGTQAGQTELMNMWKNPSTQERLKIVFGDERSFRQFAADVAKEARLKALQGVGVGSQTAARAAGMADLDLPALASAAGAVGQAATNPGAVMSALGAVKDVWGKVATPQTVRDQMGGLLMQRGPQAQAQLGSMADMIRRINEESAMYNQVGGLLGGTVAGPMIGSSLGLLR